MSAESAAVEANPKVEEAALPVIEGKTPEEVAASLQKAAKQVYFYFSDSNLPVDKFFFSLTACNEEGWVPIKTILTFKRMREFQPLGVEAVAQGLRAAAAAEGSDPLVAISEDGANVRRARPLEPVTDAWTRSVYVKGFGEGDNENNTQEKIEEWFAQFGKLNAVRRRRGDLEGKGDKGKGKGAFKGSVFAEFAYASDMEKFLANTEIPKFIEGEEMVVETKDAYVKRKCKEKGISEDEIHKNSDRKFKNGPRKFNAFREMNKVQEGRKADFAKIPEGVEIVGKAPEVSEGGKRKREDDESGDVKREKKERSPITFEYKGVTLEIDDNAEVKDPSQVPFDDGAAVKFTVTGEGDWKELKNSVIAAAIPDVFMALPAGQKVGQIAHQDGARITDEEFAKLASADLKYGGNSVSWERMSEEEQRAFWVKRANYQAKIKYEQAKEARRNEYKNGGRGGRGGKFGGHGRGGRGGFRGRGGNRGGRGGNRDNQPSGDGLPPTVGAVKSE